MYVDIFFLGIGVKTSDNLCHDDHSPLTQDGLAGVSIAYNHLNLPRKIMRNGGTLVKYSYLADGSKASALKGNGEGLVYRSSLIYRRASDGTLSLESVAFAEGMLTPEGVRYHVTDHLGSVRAVVDGESGAFLEAGKYDAYGSREEQTTEGSSDATLRWHFTGKEDQGPDFGTAYTDFGARQYSPSLRRWLVPDPLSEKYYDVSPYVYCNGNPVNMVDVDGRSTGDYYSYWGYYVGTDGLNDNKTYLIDDLSITNYLNAQSISQLDAVDALTDGAYEVDGLIIVTREQKDTDRTIGTFDAIGDDGFSGYTLEREYPTSIIPNQGRPIPVGYYNTMIRAEGEISNHFAFRIYSQDVPLSRGILGHIGTNPKNTQGCILFGMSRIQNPCELRNSGKAMDNFQVFFSSNKTIKLIIR